MKNRLKYQYVISTILVIVGCGLLIAGFCVPPVGKIDNSVLIAYGETLTFVGALMGVDYSYRAKKYINDKEDKENENDR
ncbi:MAG TPA: hypothetical protein PKC55_07415 [Dysgonomonas sp.]|uniref:hypothetical protein n=1 Tax=unclassified Dysgonomonas TaxID=2630389 RepID=UPI0025BB73F3|nr:MULTISPECIES: hypothetical protein [unclassified Dysgonomonas]HML64640.1 hypothetical protein [Dysgonomonas sp.]